MKNLKIILVLFFTNLLVGCKNLEGKSEIGGYAILALVFGLIIWGIVSEIKDRREKAKKAKMKKIIYLDHIKFEYHKLSELQEEAKKYNIIIDDNVVFMKTRKLSRNTYVERDGSKKNIKILSPSKSIYLDKNLFGYLNLSELQKEAKRYGIEIGDNSVFGEYCYILKNTKVGSNCKFDHRVEIGSQVTIYNNVMIGAKALIDHKSKIGNNTMVGNNVNVGKYVEIADNVLICHDVIIYDYCVIDSNCEMSKKIQIPGGVHISKGLSERTGLNETLGITFKE